MARPSALHGAGWTLAPDDADAQAVVAAYHWGACCMVLANGEAYPTAHCGLDHEACGSDQLLLSGSKYMVAGSQHRILLRRSVATPWACVNTTHSEHGNLVSPVRINNDGDIECMSDDGGQTCAWTAREGCRDNVISPISPLQVLVCGDDHNEKHGTDGYSNPGHWCAESLALFGSPI